MAAHLDPQILLVDEVLAVGDVRFQRKCLDTMDRVRKSGRTVICVSHNMPAITRLCPRTILLENGAISFDGPSHHAVGMYLGSGTARNAAREWKDLTHAPGNEIVRLRAVRERSQDGEVCESIDIRRIEMEFQVLQPGHVLVPNYHFINHEGVCVFVAIEQNGEWHQRPRPTGKYSTTAWIPSNFLSEGALIITAGVTTMTPLKVHFFERDVVAFHVIDSLEGNSARGDYAGPIPGLVRPLLNWKSHFVSDK